VRLDPFSLDEGTGTTEAQRSIRKGAPDWMVTFGDIMTLLMCFFVLLLSFSSMEAERFKIVAGQIRNAFGVERTLQHTEIPAGTSVVGSSYGQATETKAILFEQIDALVGRRRLEAVVALELEKDGVRLDMRDALLFEPGSAALRDEAKPILDEVAEIMRLYGGRADVRGHTDDRPVLGDHFESAWELSAARSAAVVRHIARSGIPEAHLTLSAFGASRPRSENYTEEGRRKNRRVEIMIVAE
jgi:chemotaxis protein MotB